MVEVHLGRAPQSSTQASAIPPALEDTNPDQKTVVDRKGRKLVVRRPELLAEFQFAESAGKEAAENQAWMNMAMPLIYLAELNSSPAPLLRNKLAIDGLIVELGREGYSALVAAIQEIVKDDDKMEPLKVKNS